MSNPLSINIAKMAWKTPLCVASGHAGFAYELASIPAFPFQSLGAITLKGTTLQARTGHPMHRVWETPGGIINAVGLENPGVQGVIEEHLPRLKALPQHLHFIANICGSDVDEYAMIAQAFDATTVSALEINISCPNVKQGGALFGYDPILSAEVIAACRLHTKKPLIVKLSPNQSTIAKTAESCIKAGADVICAINTMPGMVIDPQTKRAILGGYTGGVSGPAMQPIALLKVHEIWQVAQSYNIPIIGMGGIQCAEDVLSFFLAGASACAMGTALAHDSQTPKYLCRDLKHWLHREGIEHISMLTGALQKS